MRDFLGVVCQNHLNQHSIATFVRTIHGQTTNFIGTNHLLKFTHSFSPSYFHPRTNFHPRFYLHPVVEKNNYTMSEWNAIFTMSEWNAIFTRWWKWHFIRSWCGWGCVLYGAYVSPVMRASPSTCRVLTIDWQIRGLCHCLWYARRGLCLCPWVTTPRGFTSLPTEGGV